MLEAASAGGLHPEPVFARAEGYDLIVGVGFDQATRRLGRDASRPRLRDRRRRPQRPAGQAEERPGPAVPRGTGRLPRRLPRRAAGGGRGRARLDLHRRRVQGAAGRPFHRRLPGGCGEGLPGIPYAQAYSQNWVDQAKCKELALNQIAAGSGVVFPVAGGCGLGALDAAGERNRWAVGVDADQSYLGKHILTSAQERCRRGRLPDDPVRRRPLVEGRGQCDYGLRGGVGLGKVSPLVPVEASTRPRQARDRRRQHRGHPEDTRQELNVDGLGFCVTVWLTALCLGRTYR